MEEQHPVRFGNYEIIRPIDTGGMGEVYLARQRSAFGRLVALKIIRNDLMHDLTARERFLREARVSLRLKHEHILNMIEFGEEQGRLYLVTPVYRGRYAGSPPEKRPALALRGAPVVRAARAGRCAYSPARGHPPRP